jgi:IS5 family transposase
MTAPRQGNADQVHRWHATCIVRVPETENLALADDQNAKCEQYRKPAKREAFLATMEQIVHWAELADATCEDALSDCTALRRFVGIDFGRERMPDTTSLLKFRRLLEKHKLGEARTDAVRAQNAQGLAHGTRPTLSSCMKSASTNRGLTENRRSRMFLPLVSATRSGELLSVAFSRTPGAMLMGAKRRVWSALIVRQCCHIINNHDGPGVNEMLIESIMCERVA